MKELLKELEDLKDFYAKVKQFLVYRVYEEYSMDAPEFSQYEKGVKQLHEFDNYDDAVKFIENEFGIKHEIFSHVPEFGETRHVWLSKSYIGIQVRLSLDYNDFDGQMFGGTLQSIRDIAAVLNCIYRKDADYDHIEDEYIMNDQPIIATTTLIEKHLI